MNDTRRPARVAESNGVWGFFFLLAYVGAAIYFVAHSSGGFWSVVLGLLQAIVWPVYLIYHLLETLGV